jgi:sirohydrochlorin cobaltochelatase
MTGLMFMCRGAILATVLTSAWPLAAQQYEVRAPSGMAHSMDRDSLDVLRAKVPSYRTMSDDEINASMGRMPPDWTWYGSPESVKDDIGVLVIAHGSGTNGDRILQEGVTPLAQKQPTAIGFGMAMMSSIHIQQGLDKLTGSGAKTIVVVPAVVTEQSSIYRQWAYLFGRRDDSAYLNVDRIQTSAKVIMAPAMDEHPLVTQILLDHAKAISTAPDNEVVILLGHGPTFDHENEIELKHIATHAKRIKDQGKFFDAKGLTLQDDAPEATRTANVKKLRAWVSDANASGKTPLVVGYLISTRGIQDKIAEDLTGLSYKFQTKGLSAHPNFTAWIRASVAEQTAGL